MYISTDNRNVKGQGRGQGEQTAPLDIIYYVESVAKQVVTGILDLTTISTLYLLGLIM